MFLSIYLYMYIYIYIYIYIYVQGPDLRHPQDPTGEHSGAPKTMKNQ